MKSIAEFVRDGISNLSELQDALQTAVRLEFSTIPPYLCAEWSITEGGDPDDVGGALKDIVRQEMYHFAIAGNILSAIGRTPKIANSDFLPKYPTNYLPGGIFQPEPVDLKPISPAQIQVFMQIEYPEFTPIAEKDADTPATIGDFYNTILKGLVEVNPDIKQDAFYISYGEVKQVKTLQDAQDAIGMIKEEGEGTSTSPDQNEQQGELAHYYRFKEIYVGRKLIRKGDAWEFDGDRIQFPTKRVFSRSPDGSPEFNKALSTLLIDLEACWSSGTALGKSLQDMTNYDDPTKGLDGIGKELIKKGICPEFLWSDPTTDRK
ncbi:ferritin-like domain-containing protein [Mesorhizobium sp. 128a]